MQKNISTRSHNFDVPARKGGIAAPVIFVIVALLALAIFYVASFSKGSRDEYEEAQKIKPNAALAEKTLSESRSAESQFNSIHELKKGQITSEDIDIFENAVKLYEKHLTYAGTETTYNPRFEKMRRQLHDLRADILRRNSTQLEVEGEAFAREKKYADAERCFSEASSLEYRITKEYPLAVKKNHARANFLENRARAMHAIPLQAKAASLAEAGEAAINETNWAKAEICLSEALAIEREIWADYRNVVFSTDTRIRRLLVLIETVHSAHDYEQREQAAAAAREEELAGNWDAAAAKWATALEAQENVCKNFPKSRFAEEALKKELAVKFANAKAHTEFVVLKKEFDDLCANVRSRNLAQVPLLAKQALRRAEKILRETPDTDLISEDFLSELRYMDLKAQNIASIQQSFFASLLPIPGAEKTVKMTKTEIPQSLYAFVMPFNPSARSDLNRPVESVDFNDVNEFCRRLSLLVGCTVRLPTIAEFSAAAGTPADSDTLLAQAWLIENSSGIVHAGATAKANAAGFFDLYGNVSEWVLTTGKGDSAEGKQGIIAGGDCQTSAYAFPGAMFKPTLLTDKSRTRGFRVVAELPAENAPADASSAK